MTDMSSVMIWYKNNDVEDGLHEAKSHLASAIGSIRKSINGTRAVPSRKLVDLGEKMEPRLDELILLTAKFVSFSSVADKGCEEYRKSVRRPRS